MAILFLLPRRPIRRRVFLSRFVQGADPHTQISQQGRSVATATTQLAIQEPIRKAAGQAWEKAVQEEEAFPGRRQVHFPELSAQRPQNALGNPLRVLTTDRPAKCRQGTPSAYRVMEFCGSKAGAHDGDSNAFRSEFPVQGLTQSDLS